MSRTKERQQKNKIRIALIVVSCVLFVIGYYLLNEVSTRYQVSLGPTFYVVTGCSLMAISCVYTGYAIKKIFFTKKKKRTKHVFLNPNSKSNSRPE